MDGRRFHAAIDFSFVSTSWKGPDIHEALKTVGLCFSFLPSVSKGNGNMDRHISPDACIFLHTTEYLSRVFGNKWQTEYLVSNHFICPNGYRKENNHKYHRLNREQYIILTENFNNSAHKLEVINYVKTGKLSMTTTIEPEQVQSQPMQSQPMQSQQVEVIAKESESERENITLDIKY